MVVLVIYWFLVILIWSLLIVLIVTNFLKIKRLLGGLPSTKTIRSRIKLTNLNDLLKNNNLKKGEFLIIFGSPTCASCEKSLLNLLSHKLNCKKLLILENEGEISKFNRFQDNIKIILIKPELMKRLNITIFPTYVLYNNDNKKIVKEFKTAQSVIFHYSILKGGDRHVI
jgi:thioredoxin-related protein